MNKKKPAKKIIKKKIKPLTGDYAVLVPVYGIGILFSFNQSNEQINQRLKLDKLPLFDLVEEKDRSIGSTYTTGSTTALVVMKEWPKKASQYNTLQHEIFHACDLTLRNIGFHLNDGSHEAWAYMIGHVTEKIYQILWDKKYH